MSNQDDTVELIESIDKTLKQVRTQSLDISFNELLDMYINEELIIDPDYQRNFQWSDEKMSRFIESLILEMPIPPIFVIESEDGKYELIDGLQRMSSYFYFRGKLNALEHDPPLMSGRDQLELVGCDIVEALNGRKFEDLGTAIQIRLKRYFIRVEVVRKESDIRLKYHMFKRLNTGGENLSEQQIRNCTIKLLSDDFNKYLIELSKNEDFRNCTQNITDQQRKETFDQELVLRFFAFKNNFNKFKHDVADFLTEYMENVSDPKNSGITFSYNNEKTIFEKTFQLLSRTLGEYAFSYVNKKDNYVSSFSALQFEVFTLGIQSSLDKVDLNNASQISTLKSLFDEVKRDQMFKALATGGGKNSAGQLKRRVEFLRGKMEGVI
jgi:hypothetical protein